MLIEKPASAPYKADNFSILGKAIQCLLGKDVFSVDHNLIHSV